MHHIRLDDYQIGRWNKIDGDIGMKEMYNDRHVCETHSARSLVEITYHGSMSIIYFHRR